MNKPIIGAALVGAAVVVANLAMGYTNFREVKQVEFMQVQTQAKVEKLAATPTATLSATPTVTPTKVTSPAVNSVRGK